MAEVLSPPMLHSRPSSSDAFQGQQQYPQSPRLGQPPRSMYNGQNGSYRGISAAPVQPYAFQATPQLRQDPRSVAATTIAHVGRPNHAPSDSTSSSDGSSVPSGKDDSVISSRPGSVIHISTQLPDLSFTPFDAQPVKASPDRYRRPAQKRVESSGSAVKVAPAGSAPPSGSGMANVSHLYQQQQTAQRPGSVDDLSASKTSADLAKRYRRKSLNTLDTHTGSAGAQRSPSGAGPTATSTPTTIRPVSFASHSGSEEGEGQLRTASSTSLQATDTSKKEGANVHEGAKSTAKLVGIPPRGSSDASKRLATPSPLSRQANGATQPPPSVSAAAPKAKTYAAAAQSAVAASAAAQQLAAVSDKDLGKNSKSRLRRAFSFGSSHELRKAAGENNRDNNHQAAAKLQIREQHKQQIDDELDAEQQEIARRQEAAGIGAGIYSGQGGFSGSTDNLSISSTASSASMMLRKIGHGAKKSARSIKGLFRPKSVVGVPAADGPIASSAGSIVQPSVAQVSMVTVEAERQKLNINADVSEKAGGVTGFPRLERNSIDAANATAQFDVRASADGSDSQSRRSIVGSDKDRAEVLAAVKKGILKRSGTVSPNGSPILRPSDAGHTPLPALGDTPTSSMPSTPKDNQQARTASLNGDYFTQRLAVTMTKSMPATPNGTRNISFSPRIQFHDAWSATEYDRRGEIATCNRLTPMLAQQIKEELNTFKMEMEVHEMSKPHTHFF